MSKEHGRCYHCTSEDVLELDMWTFKCKACGKDGRLCSWAGGVCRTPNVCGKNHCTQFKSDTDNNPNLIPRSGRSGW